MTREEAMCKLLSLGALTLQEADWVCCWPKGEAQAVLGRLQGAQFVRGVRHSLRRQVFRLTARGVRAVGWAA